MTQKYQVKVSMKQAAVVETGIVLKQGDFGMQIEIEVLDFDVTGTTPQIVFRKAMGAVESTTITASGNKYTYTFKGTELDTPGKCFCDLKLKNSTTQRISTASFMFKVVADTLDGLAEESSSYSDTIAQIVNGYEGEVNNLKNDVYGDRFCLTNTNLSTGYYYNGTASLISNANSYYTPNPIDVSKYKKIKIRLSSTTSGSRYCGFINNNGYFVYGYTESQLAALCVLKDGMYEAELDVTTDKFVFSCPTSINNITISAEALNYYTKEESNAITDNVIIYGEPVTADDMSEGYFYTVDTSTQEFSKSANAGSYYTDAPIDVSNYLGGKLRLELSLVKNTSTRAIGFTDSNDLIQEWYLENTLPYIIDPISGKYIVELDIKYPKFVFSCSKDTKEIFIQPRVTAAYSKAQIDDEINVIKRNIGMSPAKHQLDVSMTAYTSGNRQKTLVYPLNGLKSFEIAPIAGFQTALFAGTPSDSRAVTSWSSTGSKYESNGAYAYIWGFFRKPDDSAISQNEYDTISEALTVYGIDSASEIAYVSPDGSDTNGGTSFLDAFKTIQKAIDEGYHTILLAAGEYKNQQITILNKHNIRIACQTENEESVFDDDHQRKAKARLDNSIDVELESYDDIYRAALTVSADSSYQKVFIDQTLDIIYTSPEYYGQIDTYNAILWEVTNDSSTTKQLVPVLTEADCKATEGTFFFDGSYVYVNPYNGSIEGKTYKRLSFDTKQIGILIDNGSSNIILDGIEVAYFPYTSIYARGKSSIELRNCVSKCTCYQSGFRFGRTDAVCYNCTSIIAGTDGYNIIDSGDVSLYNCSAYYCRDDGISHHDACTGFIDGGIWEGCLKGGITPSYGSRVNVKNAVCRNNNKGIYFLANASGRHTDAPVIVSDCLSYNNATYDIEIGQYTVILYGCVYETERIESSANVTKYGNTIIA